MDSSERSDTLVSGVGDNNQRRGEGDAVAEAATDAELEVRVVVETEMSSLEVKVVAKRLNWERLRELIAKVGRSGRREVERIGRHRNCHRRWGEDDVIMRNVVQRQQEQLQLRLWRCKSVEACGGGHGEELGGGNGEVWDQSELHFSVQ
nr:TMV resistance protein N-like [Ipomoea batatas]